ncbi:hypothetical protein [Yonghaparkia sp. Root332]|uniref:hypothetical protein n=1 Tax=Yonghaparkia sp. Root332 TaxID=1736516 RepID=UPI0006F5202D|nr:hypothetical protein [Yonghaparkia sp. Root332]KQV25824.1 hypothetical protein ASC54_02265 [Yonghaparkia sp. Root332]
MGNRGLTALAAGIAAAVLVIGGIGTAAYASDVRTTVETALSSLGVQASEELVDDLVEDDALDDALEDDGVTDGDDAEGDAADGDDAEGDEAEGGDAESTDEELEESFLAWNERAELWRTAFAEVKTEFDACRAEAEGGKGDCAVAFSGRLQVAFAETLVEFLESQSAAIAALPEEDRAAAQEELDRRLSKAIDKLDRTQARVADRDAARLERAMTKLGADEESTDADAESPSDTGSAGKPGKPEKPGKPDKVGGSGNSGGGGKPDHAGKPGGK